MLWNCHFEIAHKTVPAQAWQATQFVRKSHNQAGLSHYKAP